MSTANTKANKNRRPLKSRNHSWAQSLAVGLSKRGAQPNHISLASLVFALFAFFLLWISGDVQPRWLPSLYVAAALCCQLRLLCNLMDGMVAMESSVQSPTGIIWNELPDRFSDVLFFVGVGLAVNDVTLAWAVAAFAILLSYIREFGHGVDGEMDFIGPMAKPQRMALLTIALLIASIVEVFPAFKETAITASNVLTLSLWIAVFGCIVTLIRRITRLGKRVSS